MRKRKETKILLEIKGDELHSEIIGKGEDLVNILCLIMSKEENFKHIIMYAAASFAESNIAEIIEKEALKVEEKQAEKTN